MSRRFLVISGLPGSGKSTLGLYLAKALALPLLDKDHILERLFASNGSGDIEWRRKLSRESDRELEILARASDGAVIASHWHLPGMPPTSGTPTSWITQLPGKVVHVHCMCSPELSARRFANRVRHPGHLDHWRQEADFLVSIRQTATYGILHLRPCIEVDTSRPHDLVDVVEGVCTALTTLAGGE